MMREDKKGRKRVSYKKKYLKTKKELEAKEKELAEMKDSLSILEEKFNSQEKELKSVDREARQYLDYLKKLKAEFENYKKRNLKERERIISFSNEDLIKELLPLIDDLERALSSTGKNRSKEFAVFIKGVEMIFNQFKNILKKRGLEEIRAEGETFDPYFHEAILKVELDEYPDNFVVEEMRKGYKLKDKVLRPSMVKVNKKSHKETKK